jgi:hypothetical protein
MRTFVILTSGLPALLVPLAPLMTLGAIGGLTLAVLASRPSACERLAKLLGAAEDRLSAAWLVLLVCRSASEGGTPIAHWRNR